MLHKTGKAVIFRAPTQYFSDLTAIVLLPVHLLPPSEGDGPGGLAVGGVERGGRGDVPARHGHAVTHEEDLAPHRGRALQTADHGLGGVLVVDQVDEAVRFGRKLLGFLSTAAPVVVSTTAAPF